MDIRTLATGLCPPLVLQALRRFRRQLRLLRRPSTQAHAPGQQELGIYWTPQFAAVLETWGEGTAWAEIQLLLCHCKGKVLDIACGSGKVLELNSRFGQLDLHGCDISEFLVRKARERGVPANKLKVCDATATGYGDEEFDYSYSIGSLEHFTEEGITAFLAESRRITRNASFHHIPVSRKGVNEGWITPYQSYFNNSVSWWREKFQAAYPIVHALDSSWEDDISCGKWFVCIKRLSPLNA